MSTSFRPVWRDWLRRRSNARCSSILCVAHEDALGAARSSLDGERPFEVLVVGEAAGGRCRGRLAALRRRRRRCRRRRRASRPHPPRLGLSHGVAQSPGRRLRGRSCSINSSACTELSPRPTRATSGCTVRVSAPISVTNLSGDYVRPSDDARHEIEALRDLVGDQDPEARPSPRAVPGSRPWPSSATVPCDSMADRASSARSASGRYPIRFKVAIPGRVWKSRHGQTRYILRWRGIDPSR